VDRLNKNKKKKKKKKKKSFGRQNTLFFLCFSHFYFVYKFAMLSGRQTIVSDAAAKITRDKTSFLNV